MKRCLYFVLGCVCGTIATLSAAANLPRTILVMRKAENAPPEPEEAANDPASGAETPGNSEGNVCTGS